jgi:hypothetical protein
MRALVSDGGRSLSAASLENPRERGEKEGVLFNASLLEILWTRDKARLVGDV